MKTPPEPRRRWYSRPRDGWLIDLKAAAEMRVSSYFMPHDDQMVIVRRGHHQWSAFRLRVVSRREGS